MKKYMFSAAVIALLCGLPLLLVSGNGNGVSGVPEISDKSDASDLSDGDVSGGMASHCCWSAEPEAALVASNCCWSAAGEVDLRL